MSLLRERRQPAIWLSVTAESLEILKNVANTIPFLSTAAGIALVIVQKLTAVNENKDRCRSTAERIVQVFLTIAETFKDIDPNAVPSQTARNVEKLQHRLNEILSCIEKIIRQRKLTRFFMAKTITAKLEDLNAQLDSCLQLFQISSLGSIQYLIERYTGQLAEDKRAIQRYELDLQDMYEIYSGPGYAISTGTRGGAVVAIKSFVGPHAKKRWTENVTHDLQSIHANVATLIGTSGASHPSPYIVYGNISGSLEEQLAFSLGSGLQQSIEACVRMIHGIAAGLLHLDSQGIMITKIGIDNIHVFSGNNSRAVIAIEWADQAVPEDFDVASLNRPIDVLDTLNMRIFQEANNILHDDWVSRSLSSETNDELELVREAPSEESNSSQTVCGWLPPDDHTLLHRGLVWRRTEDTRLSLSDVYQEAKRLDIQLRASPSYALPSRWYRHHSPLQDSVPSRSQEELTFSVRVKEYKIISRDVWITGQDTPPTHCPPDPQYGSVHSTEEEEGLGAPALISDSVAHEMGDSAMNPPISSPAVYDHSPTAEGSSGMGLFDGVPRSDQASNEDALSKRLPSADILQALSAPRHNAPPGRTRQRRRDLRYELRDYSDSYQKQRVPGRFVCLFCITEVVAFDTEADRKQHYLGHALLVAYRCGVNGCPEEYVDRYSLKIHQRADHDTWNGGVFEEWYVKRR